MESKDTLGTGFTAEMESNLDEIEIGNRQRPSMAYFAEHFQSTCGT